MSSSEVCPIANSLRTTFFHNWEGASRTFKDHQLNVMHLTLVELGVPRGPIEGSPHVYSADAYLSLTAVYGFVAARSNELRWLGSIVQGCTSRPGPICDDCPLEMARKRTEVLADEAVRSGRLTRSDFDDLTRTLVRDVDKPEDVITEYWDWAGADDCELAALDENQLTFE